jgi:lipopolysaccharide/colanic/teichoic acid biosynthesis glycosyltransferase
MDTAPQLDNSEDVTPTAPYFRWKAGLGRVLAGFLLVPGVPIMLLLVLLVRLTSRGPGLYRQVRVGKGGKKFGMFKIRTMRCDAESDGAQWTQENDPRITRLGRVLRKLHLDEFPQLINVVRGEMDLIGPRPERPEFIQVLAREIPGYMNRLQILPGVTGLAQINLPPDTDLDSVRRKLKLDLEYIRTATFLLDLRMFVSTLLRMFGLRGEYAMRLMRLERYVALQDSDRTPTVRGDAPATPISLAASTVKANGAQPKNGVLPVNGAPLPAPTTQEHVGFESSQ